MKKLYFMVAFFTLFLSAHALAEKNELSISKQYGIAYLPLVVAEEQKLIEKNAKAAGLGEINVKWVTFSGGASANDALLTGSVDLISGGIAPFVRLWDKTQGKVKALVAIDQAPLVLNSNNPNVKTLKDLTDKDRIALPAVKVSIQALVLQMAAAKTFGIKNYDKLDTITIALRHPDAFIALTSSKSEITGHFVAEPYASLEQQNPNIHQVFNSYELLGGRHTSNLIWATDDFYKNNPKLAAVVAQSIKEADIWIKGHKKEAGELYLKAAKSNEPLALLEKILNDPNVSFETEPLPNITQFSDFLFETGAIKNKPANWKILFYNKAN